jgi:hypothetical protein
MNRNVHRQIAEERGVDIREPSTAYLFINSRDRTNLTAPTADYYLASNTQIGAGFFTRMAVQEVVMEYSLFNINDTPVPYDDDGVPRVYAGTNYFRVTISGATLLTVASSITPGFYNVAECMNALVAQLNVLTSPTYVWSISGDATFGAVITCRSGGNIVPVAWRRTDGAENLVWLTLALSFRSDDASGNPVYVTQTYPYNPALVQYTYIDIQSSQLTYNQNVRDSNTIPPNKSSGQADAIYRWYMAWDTPPDRDQYGFPILMSYEPFNCRRCIPFPKQIAWSPLQTLSSLNLNTVGFDSLTSGVARVVIPKTNPQQYLEFQVSLLMSEV